MRTGPKKKIANGMHFVHNTSSTEVIMVMWHSVCKNSLLSRSLPGEEPNESIWSWSDVLVEDHSIFDESIVYNGARWS